MIDRRQITIVFCQIHCRNCAHLTSPSEIFSPNIFAANVMNILGEGSPIPVFHPQQDKGVTRFDLKDITGFLWYDDLPLSPTLTVQACLPSGLSMVQPPITKS
jgi:hypothetical protein